MPRLAVGSSFRTRRKRVFKRAIPGEKRNAKIRIPNTTNAKLEGYIAIYSRFEYANAKNDGFEFAHGVCALTAVSAAFSARRPQKFHSPERDALL